MDGSNDRIPPPQSRSPPENGRTMHRAASVALRYNPSNVSAPFPAATKVELKHRNGGRHCWFFPADINNVCHLIGNREGELFNSLCKRGLLTFSDRDSVENGICLCPNCHRAFEKVNSPEITFFPGDIHFFIDFEQKDFMRRKDLLESKNVKSRRRTPDAETYLTHQKDTLGEGELDPDAKEGLYKRYRLQRKDTTYPILTEIDPGAIPQKSWHGCPMAALARTFQTLPAKNYMYPGKDREDLTCLMDMYAAHEIDFTQTMKQRGQSASATHSGPGGKQDEEPRPGDERTRTQVNSLGTTAHLSQDLNDVAGGGRRKRRRLAIDETRSKSETLVSGEWFHNQANETEDRYALWALGPQGTAADAIKFYTSIKTLSQPNQEGAS